jgi:hypothetical protein
VGAFEGKRLAEFGAEPAMVGELDDGAERQWEDVSRFSSAAGFHAILATMPGLLPLVPIRL